MRKNKLRERTFVSILRDVTCALMGIPVSEKEQKEQKQSSIISFFDKFFFVYVFETKSKTKKAVKFQVTSLSGDKTVIC